MPERIDRDHLLQSLALASTERGHRAASPIHRTCIGTGESDALSHHAGRQQKRLNQSVRYQNRPKRSRFIADAARGPSPGCAGPVRATKPTDALSTLRQACRRCGLRSQPRLCLASPGQPVELNDARSKPCQAPRGNEKQPTILGRCQLLGSRAEAERPRSTQKTRYSFRTK